MWKKLVPAHVGPETQAVGEGPELPTGALEAWVGCSGEASPPCSSPSRPGNGVSGKTAGLDWVNFTPLFSVLQEAAVRFTLPGSGTEGPAKQENFILGSCG